MYLIKLASVDLGRFGEGSAKREYLPKFAWVMAFGEWSAKREYLPKFAWVLEILMGSPNKISTSWGDWRKSRD